MTSSSMKVVGWALLVVAVVLSLFARVVIDDWGGSDVEIHCGAPLDPNNVPTRIQWTSDRFERGVGRDVPVLHPDAKRDCNDRLASRGRVAFVLGVLGGIVLATGFQRARDEREER